MVDSYSNHYYKYKLMNINSTKFKDLKILKLKRFTDLRGKLVKTINKNYKFLRTI